METSIPFSSSNQIVAQLGERRIWVAKVGGSSPLYLTTILVVWRYDGGDNWRKECGIWKFLLRYFLRSISFSSCRKCCVFYRMDLCGQILKQRDRFHHNFRKGVVLENPTRILCYAIFVILLFLYFSFSCLCSLSMFVFRILGSKIYTKKHFFHFGSLKPILSVYILCKSYTIFGLLIMLPKYL